MKVLLLQFQRRESRRKMVEETFRRAFAKFNLEPEIIPFPILEKDIDKDEFKKYDRVIFSGSELSFEGKNEPEEVRRLAQNRAEYLKEFIYNLQADSTPSLAICFGHQVWAYAFGSKVARDDCRGKAGTFKVYVKDEYKNDPLLKNLPHEFYAAYMHQDAVCSKPEVATILATGERCRCAIMSYGNNSYTTQFHPEFSKEDLLLRQKMFPGYFKNQINPPKDFFDTSESQKILKNFIEEF